MRRYISSNPQHLERLSKIPLRKHPVEFGLKLSKIRKEKIKRGEIVFSDETRRKMSLSKMGGKLSKEHIEIIKRANKGIKRDESYREKLRKANIGKKYSKETRKRMSIAQKRLYAEGHKKPWNKGLTKETDKRIMGVSKFMKEEMKHRIIPLRDSSIEQKIQDFLSQLHIEFFTHKYISDISHSYNCDIFIPEQEGIKQKTIIECDGCFYHCCPICNHREFIWTRERKNIDELRTQELMEKGFKVIRLWEHEIRRMNLNQFEVKLK